MSQPALVDPGYSTVDVRWLSGVSVCIPAFNEARVIADTVAEADEVLAQLPGEHEILVVDDGSRDETWQILEELRERYPRLCPVRHDQNRGLAAAQQTLIQHARGTYIFHIGADREWRMSELPAMLDLIEQDHDVVIGVRQRKQYTLWRKFVSGCFNRLVALLWGKDFGDIGSIKLIRSQLWKQVPFGSSTAFVNAQRLLIAYQNGARIATTPVEHVARTSGTSKFTSPRQAWRALKELLRFRFSTFSRHRLPDDWRTRELTP